MKDGATHTSCDVSRARTLIKQLAAGFVAYAHKVLMPDPAKPYGAFVMKFIIHSKWDRIVRLKITLLLPGKYCESVLIITQMLNSTEPQLFPPKRKSSNGSFNFTTIKGKHFYDPNVVSKLLSIVPLFGVLLEANVNAEIETDQGLLNLF